MSHSGVPAPGLIASPCINVCTMDAQSGLCTGCGRTLEEIAAWGSANNKDKQQILEAIARRPGPHRPVGHSPP